MTAESKQGQGQEQRLPPRNFPQVFAEIKRRRRERKLHALGDHGYAIAIEAAAIIADNPEAEQAAHDFRVHLAQGGELDDFLEENPEYRDIDFSTFLADEGAMKMASELVFPPTTARPAFAPPAPERSFEPEIVEEVITEFSPEELQVEEPIIEEKPAKTEKVLARLSEEYPAVGVLYDDSKKWAEIEGEDFIARQELGVLFISKKTGERPTNATEQWLMRELWKEWKKECKEEPGRKVKNRISLTPGEMLNFLWFVHTRMSDFHPSYAITKEAKVPERFEVEESPPIPPRIKEEKPVVEEPALTEPKDLKEKRRLLIKEHPKIKKLFSNEENWEENPEDPGERTLPRIMVERLIVPKEPGTISNPKSYASYAMSRRIGKKWLSLFGKELGFTPAEKGNRKYLTEDDVVNLLWLLHSDLGRKGFCQGLKLDDGPAEEVVKKK